MSCTSDLPTMSDSTAGGALPRGAPARPESRLPQVDGYLVLEELGRALCPVPYASTIRLGPTTIPT